MKIDLSNIKKIKVRWGENILCIGRETTDGLFFPDIGIEVAVSQEWLQWAIKRGEYQPMWAQRFDGTIEESLTPCFTPDFVIQRNEAYKKLRDVWTEQETNTGVIREINSKIATLRGELRRYVKKGSDIAERVAEARDNFIAEIMK